MEYLESQFIATFGLLFGWMVVYFVSRFAEVDFEWDSIGRELAMLMALSLLLAPSIHWSITMNKGGFFVILFWISLITVSSLFVKLRSSPLENYLVVFLIMSFRGSLGIGFVISTLAFS